VGSTPVVTRTGARVRLDGELGRLGGPLLWQGEPGYEEARALWNAMVDRRPAVIARCTSAEDARRCLAVARERDLVFSVRGAGHNVAGRSSCDGGLMIDLSPMRRVEVDAAGRRARVEGGATLADVDRATQASGLAVPLGINSTTGIGGLTLGGGFGWLSRKLGLTADNLMAADVLLADGRSVRSGEGQDEELLWGLRGGGGNLGLVTSFEFRLHPVGPEVTAGLVVHPLDAAPEALRHWRESCGRLPEDAAAWVILRKAPLVPFVPPQWHGREVLILALFHAGEPERAEADLRPLRSFGRPLADVVARQPYVAFQSAFDPLLAPGARNYWKSHNFETMEDAALELLLEHARRLPSPQCEVFVGQLGGAVSRVAPDATAYPHRDAAFVMNVHGRWDDARDDAQGVGWARSLHAALAPLATGGVYVNFVSEGEEAARAAYGVNYDRLAGLKRRYDPENRFRANQNVPPAAA
jgi:FAD/FMN-containing dehydrogenase